MFFPKHFPPSPQIQSWRTFAEVLSNCGSLFRRRWHSGWQAKFSTLDLGGRGGTTRFFWDGRLFRRHRYLGNRAIPICYRRGEPKNILHGDLAWWQHSTQISQKSGLALKIRAQTTNSRVLCKGGRPTRELAGNGLPERRQMVIDAEGDRINKWLWVRVRWKIQNALHQTHANRDEEAWK